MNEPNQVIPPQSSNDVQLYLASSSPRRRELLASVGLRFAVVSAEIDETRHSGEPPDVWVARLATDKARQAVLRLTGINWNKRPVLAADTCVVVDREVFGKPKDPDDAVYMLKRLTGRSHQVLTAVTVHRGQDEFSAISRSLVKIKPLADEEIKRYCHGSEPMDKAGAYAIQGLASGFVEHLEGSFTGVMGLPMYELRTLLNRVGIDWI